MCEIIVLKEGYSYMKDGEVFANATCCLIRSEKCNIIVDTLTPWDKDFLIKKISELNLEMKDIDYVVSTHGHSDHNGNNNLFLEAKHHIVGFCISNKDKYYIHPFEIDEPFVIDENVKIIPTPGHTNEDISVWIKRNDGKSVVLAGDIFEKELDIEDSSMWKDLSFDKKLQAKSRLKILKMADIIIPGHGPPFNVTPKYISIAENEDDLK